MGRSGCVPPATSAILTHTPSARGAVSVAECQAGGRLGSRIAPCLIAVERDGELAEMRGVVRGANDAPYPTLRGAGVSPAMPVFLPVPERPLHGVSATLYGEGVSTFRAALH